MKIYKILLIIIFIVLIPIFTLIFFLYKEDRILILYKKNNIANTRQLQTYQNKLFGTLIKNKEIIKIPFSITFDTFDKNHPEDFLYSIMYQFFHYMNLEYIGKINYNLNHIVLNNKNIILNGSLEQTKPLSSQDEFFLLKSIFLTINNIFPYIESIYFYNDEIPLKLNHILPFFTKSMLDEKNISKNINNDKKLLKNQIILIPYFQGNGNLIDGIYEKNIFQKHQNTCIFIPKHKIGTEEYFKEINQYKIENTEKIIFYITIKEDTKEHIDLIYYPVIPEENLIYEFESYPLCKKNNIIENTLSFFKTNFSPTSFYSYPFIPIINTIYPSLYIIIYVTNKEQITNILNKIESINLNL